MPGSSRHFAKRMLQQRIGFLCLMFQVLRMAILQMQPEMPVLDRREDRNERVPTHVRSAADQTAGRVRLLRHKPRIIQQLATDQFNSAGLQLRTG